MGTVSGALVVELSGNLGRGQIPKYNVQVWVIADPEEVPGQPRETLSRKTNKNPILKVCLLLQLDNGF